MEQHVLDLVESMVVKGHEVYVWCPQGVIAEDSKRLGAKVTLRKIKFDVDPFYILSLKKFLKENQIDIVHAHELKASTNAMIAAKLAGTEYRISHTHTPISEWQIAPLKKKLNLFVYPKIINNFATYEIALTESRKRIKEKEGIRKEKLYIVESPNAIKIENFVLEDSVRDEHKNYILDKYGLGEETVIWGCLGRLTEEKGHHILLEAFKMFLDDLPDEEKEKHHLKFTGGGHLQERFQERAKELDIESNITITGRFLDEDKIKHYASFNYFIHPSMAEGFGIVLIEAMTVGIPVIASNLEVFKEVADDTVTYFETGNAKHLSEVMKKVHKGEIKTHEMKKRAQKRVIDNYTYDKFADNYDQFYLDLKNC